MHFERTTDYALVREILTHPSLYDRLTDDHCPRREEFQPIEHPAVWYIVAKEDDELLGLWMLVPQNSVCWEVHTALLPNAWGERAGRAANEAIRWVFAHAPCRRLVTTVPTYNRLALRFAERAGMTRYGLNPNSIQKNGELHDQILLGLSRCQQ